MTSQLENIMTCGLFVEITTSQSRNFIIIQDHWVKFNAELKRYNLKQNIENWEKYGITYKINEKYFYMTSIPYFGQIIPNNFVYKEIPKGEYVFFSHTGKMEEIKNTIYNIYKKLLPNLGLNIEHYSIVGFIHFEKYDFRFQWNKPNSIVEIYLPLNMLTK
ncbi:GyrI-like domain-containing protein [Flavobacterium sp. ZS1P70]|uniref:GyrI-like domain-containing protein n=1 Tax=Flavobacterium zhoui TaxID=3230414 RepID=A0ABW6I2I2_9FLAO